MPTRRPDDRRIYEFAHGYYQNHRLSDDIYERMRARCGDKGVVDLAGLIGYYSFASVRLNVFERDPAGQSSGR